MSKDAILTISEKAAELYSSGEHDINPKQVIVDKRTTSNPTFKLPGVKIDSETIMVKSKDGRASFNTISSVFNNSNVDPQENNLSIYLPLDWIDDKDDRVKYIEQRESQMKDILMENVK